jgi:type I restriction enzyme M protein
MRDDLIAEYRTNIGKETTEIDRKYWQSNIDWLTERFPDGKYCDVIGLCKVAKIEGEDGIAEQDYSLNPGRYVGVIIEKDGMTKKEFNAEILRVNGELKTLNDDAQELERKITENLLSLVNE